MKFWWHKESEEKQLKEIERILRSTFSTDDGKVALSILLEDLKFFDITTTTEEAALRNAALILLKRMGITDTFGVTTALLGVKRNINE